MTSTTETLLLKTRKNANSAFGPKQWNEVLVALGFSVQLTKEKNSIVGFRAFNSAGEQVFETVKKPGYRGIVFYDIYREMKAAGYDLVELASKALGLDTPEIEKAKKALYERDLTNTGTCPICFGNFKMVNGLIGHHGFKRPGDGMLHGTCFGVWLKPFELSSGGDVLIDISTNNKLKLERLGTDYVMSGGRYGKHSLDVQSTSPARLAAHWEGYCTNSSTFASLS